MKVYWLNPYVYEIWKYTAHVQWFIDNFLNILVNYCNRSIPNLNKLGNLWWYPALLIIHHYPLSSYPIINSNLYDYCSSGVEIQLFSLLPVVTSSKACSDLEQLFFCHKRLWCNIILKAPWMERGLLTAFIWLSSTTFKSWKHQCVTLWFVVGNIKYAQMGKRKKHHWQHPCLVCALIRSELQLGFRPLQTRNTQYVENHKHVQTIKKNPTVISTNEYLGFSTNQMLVLWWRINRKTFPSGILLFY